MPTYSSGTSTRRSSIGSSRTPARSRTTGAGLDACSSKPSRRMVSIRIASWSSPRPRTRKASVLAVSSTRRLTFRRLSCPSRSRSFLDVTWLPERPAHGLVFTPNTIAMVGSSMRMGGSASGRSRSATVSPMWMSSMPAMATMSPAQARSSSMRFNPCQP